LAQEMGPDKNVVVVLPDTGERYFSFYKFFN
jgi:cysteine synthase